MIEAVASRVFRGPSGGGGSAAGGGRLPPELEGDERLRSIEPKMVELIMNEVRSIKAGDVCGVCASATGGFSGYIKLAYCSSAKGLQ